MSSTGSIRTNLGALEALNSLSATNLAESVTSNELASGLAINSPADDPAGSIEAAGFTSQIGGEDQALSNANQALSLLQTAQGGITQQSNIAQKLYSLAVQAANGTETSQERSSLQNVASQLLGEMNGIAQNTTFNGQNLLNGSFSGVQFQVGANNAQTISLSIGSTQASKLGKQKASYGNSYYTLTQDFPYEYANSWAGSLYNWSASQPNTPWYADVNIIGTNGSQETQLVDGPTDQTGLSISNYKNANGSANTGVKLVGQPVVVTLKPVASSFDGKHGSMWYLTLGVHGYQYKGSTNYFSSPSQYFSGSSVKKLASSINAASNLDVKASINNSGSLVLTENNPVGSSQSIGYMTINTRGNNWDVKSSAAYYSNHSYHTSSDTKLNRGYNQPSMGTNSTQWGAFSGDTEMISSKPFSVKNASAAGYGSHFTATAQKQANSLAGIDLSTASGAATAIDIIQSAISQLGQEGASIGAFQDQVQATISNDHSVIANETSALSVVQDANIPAVTETMNEDQIAAQSGIAALKESSQLQESYMALMP